KSFSAVVHPQANGQVEAINKILKQNIKTKLEEHKGAWPEVLPEVLWAYRTTQRSTTGESLFSLAYGYEAMVPVEIGASSLRRSTYEPDQNNALMRIELDLLEERHEQSQLRVASYQQRTARYYNSKVKAREFGVGDLVLRQVLPNTKEQGAGVFGPSWEGPYVIDAVIRPETYKLAHTGGQKIEHAWNAEQLRRYYQ
ncbi:Ribonuclease H-like domain containing protein, partial [Trema orientale]